MTLKQYKSKKKGSLIVDFIQRYSFIIVFCFSFGIYFNTLSYDFIHLDDDYFISVAEPQNEKLLNAVSAVSGTYLNSAFYRPATNLSFFINYQISGSAPFGYHLTNLLIHCLVCCLVYILLRKLNYAYYVSLVAALIYSAHPLFTNAVAWVAGRNDLLATFFSILSFIVFLIYIEKEKWIYLLLHGFVLILAVFSKESAIMAPFVSAAYFLLFRKNKKINLKSIALFVVWLTAIILVPLTKHILSYPATYTNFSVFNILTNWRVAPETLAKAIIPINIHALPSFSMFTTIAGSIILIVVIMFVILNKKVMHRKVIFGFLWFLIFLFPGLFIRLDAASQYFDYIDCRSYLPMVGVFIAVIEIAFGGANKLAEKVKLIFLGAFAVAIAFITVFTQIPSYTNRTVFWENAAAARPDKAMILGRLGRIYLEDMRYGRAMEVLRKALSLDSNRIYLADMSRVYYEKSNISAAHGNIVDAVAGYDKAIYCDTNNADAYNNRGYWKNELGNYEEAIRDYNKVLELNPVHPLAYNNRGYAKLQLNAVADALKDINTSINMLNNNAYAYKNRALIYIKLNRLNEACNNLQMALDYGFSDANGKIEADELIKKYCR